MRYVNDEYMCIFKNFTGRTYTNMHLTNSDLMDTYVNATCQYFLEILLLILQITG